MSADAPEFSFTEAEMAQLLETSAGQFGDHKLCGRCDHHGSVNHAGLKCAKCGGDMVLVNGWTIVNLLKRIKPSPGRGEGCLTPYVAQFICRRGTKAGEDRWRLWLPAYSWACKNREQLIEMLRNYIRSHP